MVIFIPYVHALSIRQYNFLKRKCSLKVKDRRKKLRGKQKGYLDLEKEKEEGDSYVPGGF